MKTTIVPNLSLLPELTCAIALRAKKAGKSYTITLRDSQQTLTLQTSCLHQLPNSRLDPFDSQHLNLGESPDPSHHQTFPNHNARLTKATPLPLSSHDSSRTEHARNFQPLRPDLRPT